MNDEPDREPLASAVNPEPGNVAPGGPEAAPVHAPLSRLWTPWRMGYVATSPVPDASPADSCVFCRHRDSLDDVESLIVHRGERCFVVLNLYPYNTGHFMLVPNEHVSSPEAAAPETLVEMAILLPGLLDATRSALNCAGFNRGMNIGAVAGAGIAAHLHEHVVPRWNGDANFMPVLASTKVLPELLPITYAKLRAEIAGRLRGEPVVLAAVDPDSDQVLINAESGALPSVHIEHGSVWQAAGTLLHELGASAPRLVGWAGGRQVNIGPAALAFVREGAATLAPGWRWSALPLPDAREQAIGEAALQLSRQVA